MFDSNTLLESILTHNLESRAVVPSESAVHHRCRHSSTRDQWWTGFSQHVLRVMRALCSVRLALGVGRGVGHTSTSGREADAWQANLTRRHCSLPLRKHGSPRTPASHVSRTLDPAATSEPFVTPTYIQRGEVAREWISELYDTVDYAKVFESMEGDQSDDALFDALAGDDSGNPTEGELMYGEFNMGFFIALIRSLEDEISQLEFGDVDGGAVTNGVFCDVGSGRGQICFLASVLRNWQRCVGLEIDTQLHTIAEQVSVYTTPDQKEQVVTPEFLRAFSNGRPSRQSPVSFVNGDMYDRNDLGATLENATVVFMFSTRFEGAISQEGDDGSGEAAKTLKVGPFLRPHLRVGALVVTINGKLSPQDGYQLMRTEHGPDSERVGGSTAYVWKVVEVVCDGTNGSEKKKSKKKKKIVS